MSPFEQNQEIIEKNIGNNIDIQKNSGEFFKGKLIDKISCKLDSNSTIDYYYSVFIIKIANNELLNIPWSEIKTIEFN